MASPLISIIIPLYNAERFLAATLESIVAQDRADWECVLVDDGSKDRSLEIAQSFANRDARFRVFSQANAGVARTRTHGLQLADPAARFVVFMDNDDLFVPSALSRLHVAVEALPDSSGAHGLADMIDIHGQPIGEGGFARFGRERTKIQDGRLVPCSLTEPSTFAVLIVTGIYPPGVVMFRKEIIDQAGPFDDSCRAASDWDMWIRVVRSGPLAFINEILVLYRRHDKNESNDGAYISREIRYVQRKAFFDPSNTPEQKSVSRQAYRAWQLHKIREKRSALGKALTRVQFKSSLRLATHVAAHALCYVRGYPTNWG